MAAKDVPRGGRKGNCCDMLRAKSTRLCHLVCVNRSSAHQRREGRKRQSMQINDRLYDIHPPYARVGKGEHRKQGRYADSAPTNTHISFTPPLRSLPPEFLLNFPLPNLHTQPPLGHRDPIYPSAPLPADFPPKARLVQGVHAKKKNRRSQFHQAVVCSY